MASDLETNPKDLKKLILSSNKNKEMIIVGDRWMKKNNFINYSKLKLFLNYFSQKLIKFFFNTNIQDFTFAYRVYPIREIKRLKIEELKHGFALEILLKPLINGAEVLKVPAKWVARNEGLPTNSILNYFSFIKVLIKSIRDMILYRKLKI